MPAVAGRAAAKSPIRGINVTSDGETCVCKAVMFAPVQPAAAWELLTDFAPPARWVPNARREHGNEARNKSATIRSARRGEFGAASFPDVTERPLQTNKPIAFRSTQGSLRQVESLMALEADEKGRRLTHRLEIVPELLAGVRSRRFLEHALASDTPRGRASADLFEGRRQLIVYHFMFDPDWQEGCPHCSFWADNFDGILVHLEQRDVSMLAISRAPLEKPEAFKKRMGWTFRWVSSLRNDFNYDYHVSFTPQDMHSGAAFYNYSEGQKAATEREGVSVFYKDESGVVFHTYSCYARGIDMMNTAYQYLDLVPKGRDEDGLEFTQAWVRYHDKYRD